MSAYEQRIRMSLAVCDRRHKNSTAIPRTLFCGHGGGIVAPIHSPKKAYHSCRTRSGKLIGISRITEKNPSIHLRNKVSTSENVR